MADNKIQVNAKADTLETDASKKKKEDAKKTEDKIKVQICTALVNSPDRCIIKSF